MLNHVTYLCALASGNTDSELHAPSCIRLLPLYSYTRNTHVQGPGGLAPSLMRMRIYVKGTWDDLMGTLLTMDPSFSSHILCSSNIIFPLPSCPPYTFFFNSRCCCFLCVVFLQYVVFNYIF